MAHQKPGFPLAKNLVFVLENLSPPVPPNGEGLGGAFGLVRKLCVVCDNLCFFMVGFGPLVACGRAVLNARTAPK